MAFTLTFLKLFFFGVTLAFPLLLFFVLLIIVVGQIVGKREKWTPFDSLYWSFITATTVGYGDIRPLKKLSKVLSILIAFFGLIFTGIIVAIALNAATIAFQEHLDMVNVKQQMEKISNPNDGTDVN